MRVAFRAVAYAGWALAFGLSVLLAVQLHQYKFSIALGVAVLALILSAFGLVMARHCARDKDRLAMTIGIVLWAAGATTFAITEFGFWYSSYKDNYAEYVQITKAKARQEGLRDAAWEALRTGETRANSAELEAKIRAARQNEAWTLSEKCTTATQAKSRTFCQGYFELEAKLASAGKLEALETRLIGEQVATKETVVHNVFAAADLLAENFNLTNRQAATIVVIIIAVMLMLARDLLLIVANSFGGAVAARTAAKAPRGMEVASMASSLLLTRTAHSEMTPWVAPSRKAEAPQPDDTPPPADAKPLVEEPAPVKVAGPVLVDENWKPEPSKPLSKKQRKQMERERLKDDAIRAVEEFASARLDLDSPGARFIRSQKGFVKSGGTPGGTLGKQFRQWAKSTRKYAHFATYDQNPLGKAMSAVLEAGRPTNGCGAVYAALVLVKQEQRKAVA
jgi:electron transfer flavoprotein alpha subunit